MYLHKQLFYPFFEKKKNEIKKWWLTHIFFWATFPRSPRSLQFRPKCNFCFPLWTRIYTLKPFLFLTASSKWCPPCRFFLRPPSRTCCFPTELGLFWRPWWWLWKCFFFTIWRKKNFRDALESRDSTLVCGEREAALWGEKRSLFASVVFSLSSPYYSRTLSRCRAKERQKKLDWIIYTRKEKDM